jgi:hypothetical protein
VKTLADREVREVLGREVILAMHNQVPELYCNSSVDPGTDRYPGDQVDACPESAGGGNLRVFLCRPSGEVVAEIRGYWKPPRFLSELRQCMPAAEAGASRAAIEGLHRECLARHARSSERAEGLLVRTHQDMLQHLFEPIKQLLDRIEDEIYTKGAIG